MSWLQFILTAQSVFALFTVCACLMSSSVSGAWEVFNKYLPNEISGNAGTFRIALVKKISKFLCVEKCEYFKSAKHLWIGEEGERLNSGQDLVTLVCLKAEGTNLGHVQPSPIVASS